MSDSQAESIHASAVLVGARAVLIRGPSGSGKSHLAWRLLCSGLPFVRLVSDDRAFVAPSHGRLLVRPPDKLAGLLELRGLGLRRLPYEAMAMVGMVVDLNDPLAERMPAWPAQMVEIAGIKVPRLGIAAGSDAFGLVIAAFHTKPAVF